MADDRSLCSICDKTFRYRKDLYHHIRRIHGVRVILEGKLKCPLCTANSHNYRLLRKHLQSKHYCVIESENFRFSSINDFDEWKKIIQNETKCNYFQQGGARMTPNETKKYYYICRKPGLLTTKGPNSKPSKKSATTCPSTIEALLDGLGEVHVVYWKTHIGHDGHVPITVMRENEVGATAVDEEDDDDMSADKYLQGVPFESAVVELPSGIVEDNDNLSSFMVTPLTGMERLQAQSTVTSAQGTSIGEMHRKFEELLAFRNMVTDEDVTEVNRYLDLALTAFKNVLSGEDHTYAK